MTITSSLNTVVSDVPYLKDENDVEAVITGLERLQEALSGYEGLVWLAPAANQTAREFVEDVSATATSFSK
jgi:cellobiose dehydrogenase (acceptor)